MANLYPEPTQWQNDTGPDINAENLNKIEQGLAGVATQADETLSDLSLHRIQSYVGGSSSQHYVIKKNTARPRMVFRACGTNGSDAFELLIPVELSKITPTLTTINLVKMGNFTGNVEVIDSGNESFRLKLSQFTGSTFILFESYPWDIIQSYSS